MGLKDQLLVLKWVQKNIKAFGGNPDSVTLTGLSSGALAGHMHYLSPLSRGLFHKGMLLSGTAMTATLQYNASDKAKALGSALGCPVDTSANLIKCLKGKTSAEIISGTVQSQYPYSPQPSLAFSPVLEKAGKNPFISEHPYQTLQKKQVMDIPMITSANSHDGYFISLCKYALMISTILCTTIKDDTGWSVISGIFLS